MGSGGGSLVYEGKVRVDLWMVNEDTKGSKNCKLITCTCQHLKTRGDSYLCIRNLKIFSVS